MRVPSFLAFTTTLLLIGCSGGGGTQATPAGPVSTPTNPNPPPTALAQGPGTPTPDPRPAPGPLGPSGNNRWQIGSPSGLYVVDPAAGELAVQGATAGSPPLVIVNLDKGMPPADTTVTLNGVQLIRWSGNPDFIWTLDPAGPQPVVGAGGFIELVATTASGGRQRSLVLPVPADLTLGSDPAPGTSLGTAASLTLTFPASLVLNPPGIPGLAGVYPEAFLLGYDPATRTLVSSSYGQALIGAGQLGAIVPVTAAASGQYLLDLRWPGLWQPDGETGAFCGLAKRLNYSR